VAPLSVIYNVWPNEIAKWDHTKHLTYHILHGKTKTSDPPDVDIYLINYDGLKWLKNQPHIFTNADIVVLDESTFVKNPTANRFSYAFNMFSRYPKRLLLTGTPTPNGLIDLFGQFCFIDGGRSLGGDYVTFRQNFFSTVGTGFKVRYVPRKGTIKAIADIASKYAISMNAKDYLELPDIYTNLIPVKLNDTCYALYKEMQEEFVAVINNQPVAARSKEASMNKLRQIVSGYLYDTKLNVKRTIKLHKEKLERLKDILDANPDKNFLVAVNFRAEADMLAEYFKKLKPAVVYGGTKKSTATTAIKKWNAGNLRMFIAHPASLGYGVNLQAGGHNILWFSPTWNLEHWLQMNKRLHRQGQKHPVTIHIMQTQDTIEESIARALAQKDLTQAKLLGAITC
jgi:SNF2 family DNA or RNA helicase